jgi:hypothetical protein
VHKNKNLKEQNILTAWLIAMPGQGQQKEEELMQRRN